MSDEDSANESAFASLGGLGGVLGRLVVPVFFPGAA